MNSSRIKEMQAGYTKKDLRIFSLILSLILALFSTKLCKSANILAGAIFLALSVASFLIGLLTPILIIPAYKTLSFIGKIIGGIVSSLVLGFIFYCIFTPISVVLKVSKKDILDLKVDKNKDSYWVERKDRTVKPESLEKQF